MNAKTIIKNNLWHINYIIPFARKHRYDEKGNKAFARHIVNAFLEIKPVSGKGRRSVGSDTKELLRSVEIDIDETSRFVYSLDIHRTIAVPGNVISNFTIDYKKIIDTPFDDLVTKAVVEKDEYGQEAAVIGDAVRILCYRTIKQLDRSGLEENEKRRRQEWFHHMLHVPAEHFEEALQRILFFNQIMWQTRHRLNGLGRLDFILNKYYLADLESGVLTRENAEEMIDDFLLQLSKYPDYKSDSLSGDIGQIIILGGMNPDGSYFSSELTEMFLRAQAKSRRNDPKTLLRVSRCMPDGVLRTAIECLESSTGSPLFSNDDVVVPALKSFGMADEDAYSYCTSACWEPFIVGKSLDQNNIAVFDCFSALDSLLSSDGIEEYVDFKDLLKHYLKQNQKNFRKFIESVDEMQWAKDPLVSLFTDYCSQDRLDISEGGAFYNNYGITTIGMASVVDSLVNIRELCFEKKEFTLKELNSIRQSDYDGNEEVFNRLASMKKSFGHDQKQAISLVNTITRSMSRVAENYRNEFGGTIKFGLSSPGYNNEGKRARADFAGRKNGMPFSPHISNSDVGYTEVVRFASQLNYDSQRFNGNVVDFFVSPNLIRCNPQKFLMFLKGAIRSGFFQMQMNVMDSKTLIEAKKHPERYQGLIVRVWGFSAYFNELPESYKDLMIERALRAEQLEAS